MTETAQDVPAPRATWCWPAVAGAVLALSGSDAQGEVARVLGPHHPGGARNRVDPRLVRRWSSGTRAVPRWVPDVLRDLLRRQAEELAAAARALEQASADTTH